MAATWRAVCALAVAASLSACGGDSGTNQSSAGEAFGLRVTPERVSPVVPGQRVVLLVGLEPAGAAGGPAALRAVARGAQVRVEPPALGPDGVCEVSVTPDAGIDGNVDVMLVAERRGLTCAYTVPLSVSPFGAGGGDGADLAPVAAEHRDRFVAWLAANRPDLGIAAQTEWQGTIVKPGILVVMHYLYFSDDWELGLRWHVTIPPHDWSRIYLRRRFVEAAPSLAFEIPSYSSPESQPRQVDPASVEMDAVVR